MTLDARLQALVDGLPAPDRLDFFALCESMYKIRFTGPTTIHWLNGLPRQIDLGQPVKLTICQGDVTAESEGKDPLPSGKKST